MKSVVFHSVFTFLLTVVFMLTGCGTTPPSTGAAESPADASAAGENVYEAEEAGGEIDKKDTYTGDGGKGTSITILAPEAKGLAEDQNYLPEVVQGEFMSNFSGYSGISVFDRMNLDKIYEEQLGSGYYDENDRAGLDLGHLTSTDYIMNGSITKTATGYALQIQVTKSEDKMTAASYSGTCSFAELDNLTGIRRASRDLLEKLGVSLTEKGKTELDGAAAEQAVNAQIALSKGIEAMKKGTVVEALSYFVQSQSYDPQLAEAASRVNIVSANISSGNIGADARNDIAWRKAWLERLTECEQWVTNYVQQTPVPTYLYYSTDLKQEDINYSKETLSISIEEITLRVDDQYDWVAPIIGVVNPVYAGLKATGRASAWEVGNWPNSNVARGFSALGNKTPMYETVIELVNDVGEVIGRRSVRLSAGWRTGFSNGAATASRSATSTGVRFTGVDANKITDRLSIRIASLNGTSAEDAAKANSVSIVTRDDYWRMAAQRDLAFYKGDNDRAFADYSEAIRLNLRIANAYYNRGLIYYNKNDFPRAEADFTQAVSLDRNNVNARELLAKSRFIQNCDFKNGVIIKYRGTDKDVVIPEKINGEPVTRIGVRAFTKKTNAQDIGKLHQEGEPEPEELGLGLTSIIIPSSVTSIGQEAFFGNRLTGVVIPGSVTSIGPRAFSENPLASVVIPNRVREIGDEAFYGNQFTSVVIPDNVTSIGTNAFTNDFNPSLIWVGKYKNSVSISLPANIDFSGLWHLWGRNDSPSWQLSKDPLADFYNRNRKKAGTYTWDGKKWQYEAKR
ncbi:MAG: leucine-rich repeat protein [Spirochaetaceae bacterium]|jgi:tetratricopeptide (TPR) repeat protein|nr:leucine-rich repeat protein [Spirochaetaceae bacterium]